jgi:hypothetical protein
MGHREARRVPLNFNWPMGEIWEGYLMPERLHENKCPDCEHGYSPHAEHLQALWYGYVPFNPESTGSAWLTPSTPAVREFAERNVTRNPEFYGTSEAAVVAEAVRLATLWNGQWCHHLSQEDVDALAGRGRLMDFTHTWAKGTGWQKTEPPVTPTAAEVNEWSLRGFGHDSINAGIAVSARCEREGFGDTCPTCQGHASLEAYEGQRAEAEAWERTEPPTGDGWQLWETVTEGSPSSPVFATAGELADWCENGATVFADQRWTATQWLASFRNDTTDVDSLLFGTIGKGVHVGDPLERAAAGGSHDEAPQ